MPRSLLAELENKDNMKKLMKSCKSGQALVEYALVLALIAVVAILVIKALGTKTTSTFDNIQGQMSSQGVMDTQPTAAK
jgi:Flp pilus assembly pilin Flp